jgi:ABC-type Na+ efflux pump permease subunit
MISNLGILLAVLILSLLAAILLLVFGVLLLVSNLAGWGALARVYESKPEIAKGSLIEEKKQRKVWVGAIQLGGMVIVRAYELGLEMTTKFPFSPPLFFPWEDIKGYKRVTVFGNTQFDQFWVDDRMIRLSNHIDELDKQKRNQPG